jgi:hypothetical protein
LGIEEFIPRARHIVRDDHLPLRNIGKIPTCDIIDAPQDYPAWHTTLDTPLRCSPTSLGKVGWVMYEWLREQQAAGAKPPLGKLGAERQAADAGAGS